MRDAAQEAAKPQIALVRKLFAEDVERVRALGVTVHLPTPAEMKEWQIATRCNYARWKVQVEPNLIAKIEQVVEGTRKG